MVNCGGGCVEGEVGLKQDGERLMRFTVEAMEEVFLGEVWCQRIDGLTGNVMAMTGSQPDVDRWQAAVPDVLRPSVGRWQEARGFLTDRYAQSKQVWKKLVMQK